MVGSYVSLYCFLSAEGTFSSFDDTENLKLLLAPNKLLEIASSFLMADVPSVVFLMLGLPTFLT